MNKLLLRIKESDTWLSLAEKVVNWTPMLIGASGSASIAGWAAKSTERLSRYGKAAWIFSALLGGLIFAICFRLWVSSVSQLQEIRLRRRFETAPSVVNPLEPVFRKSRISFKDFESPIRGLQKEKTFIECELIGPALIVLSGHTYLNNSSFVDCDFIRLRKAPKLKVFNGIEFENVTFQNCIICKITFLVPPNVVGALQATVKGDINWISEI
ncbi:hypothetical protein BGLT_01180 [Caballeronia glathei]|uniref:hypothetical protein n=1 Tax=Caballeronia glathei TaxID=60547 RepID=UPI000506913B|nr:hypothetical protein [Caballeronia glathei]CDY78308.1 hypothetical protein BGLT_01180 [Caballeronia glathei]